MLPEQRQEGSNDGTATRDGFSSPPAVLLPKLGEVGCIYSVQGFEFDYVGVIWGPDLVWRDGRWVARPGKSFDPGMNGKRGPIPEKAALPLLKNAYRVLCSRAMRGCSVYCLDEETAEYTP